MFYFSKGFVTSHIVGKKRPLGDLQNVVNFLEMYQCDEISIIRPVRNNDTYDALQKDLAIIQKLNCMTPISFGVALTDVSMVDTLQKLPIERLIFTSAFISQNYKLIEYAIKLYGHQAIQCAIPFKIINDELEVFHSNMNSYNPINSINIDIIKDLSNEIILIDTANEGLKDSFDERVFNYLDINYNRLVISGGIGRKTIKLAKNFNIASVMIDNKVLHTEFSIRDYKRYGGV